MPRARMFPLLLFAFFVFTPACTFAQITPADEAAARAQQEAQARADEAERRRAMAELDRLDDAARAARPIPPKTARSLNAGLKTFQQAIPRFRKAVDQFRWDLGITDKPGESLKNIAVQTDILLRYFSDAKIRHARPDPDEFNGYSRTEFRWEFLNSAERIGAYLDYAVSAERQDVVSTKTLEFLSTLDGELLRLKWMTSHFK